MSIEHGSDFMSDGVDAPNPEQPISTRQEMYEIDLGPRSNREVGLGPTSLEEDRAFRDIDDPRYIDPRPANGIHCGDDRVTQPGIQLFGGIVETLIVGEYMKHRPSRGLRLSKVTKRVVAAIGREDPEAAWVHGTVCAASSYKRHALLGAAENPGDALEFAGTVMDELKLPVEEREINEAIFIGGESADSDSLWDISYERSIQLSRRNPNVRYEEFTEPHVVAGLGIFVTPHTFYNELFAREHKVAGKKVGALAITLGAYKRYRSKFGRPEKLLAKDLLVPTLFSFGLGKTKAHDYTRAAIIRPLKGEKH